MDTKNNVTKNEVTISEIFAVIKPKLVYIVLIGVIFSLLSFIYTKMFVSPVYKSTATVIVNNRKDESSSAITNDELNSAKNLATVYGIVINSDAVMQPVVDVVNTGISANELKSKVTVNSVNNTQIIEVSVRDTDPEIANLYANEIIKIAPEVIMNMVEVGSVKVVSYPQVPGNPISPNVKKNVVLAGVIGLFSSTSFVLVAYFLDKTFKSVEDVESTLGIPVLGIIPNVDSIKRG